MSPQFGAGKHFRPARTWDSVRAESAIPQICSDLGVPRTGSTHSHNPENISIFDATVSRLTMDRPERDGLPR